MCTPFYEDSAITDMTTQIANRRVEWTLLDSFNVSELGNDDRTSHLTVQTLIGAGSDLLQASPSSGVYLNMIRADVSPLRLHVTIHGLPPRPRSIVRQRIQASHPPHLSHGLSHPLPFLLPVSHHIRPLHPLRQ